MRLGYTLVWVADVEDAVRFYEEAFGLRRRFLTNKGAMGLYAEMETGETTLTIANDREAKTLFPDDYRENHSSLPPSAFQIPFIAEDVEAAYDKALRARAVRMSEPATQPWGQTVARVRDPSGILVSIASPLRAQAS